MSSRLLMDALPELSQRFVQACRAYEEDHPGHRIDVTCTHRTPAEQQALYAQGRTMPGQIVTHVDGVKKKSRHNASPAEAIDFCVIVHGKVSWDESVYDVAGPYFERQGLVWGGSWPNFKDRPHVELPEVS